MSLKGTKFSSLLNNYIIYGLYISPEAVGNIIGPLWKKILIPSIFVVNKALHLKEWNVPFLPYDNIRSNLNQKTKTDTRT